jgi:dolichyl-phosphate-mannose--protein O-mannosyl transferase
MEKKDLLPLTLLTLFFIGLAFFGLGDLKAPQSFYRFKDTQTPLVIRLPEKTQVTKLMFYTGLYVGHYTLEHSEDGETWTESVLENDELVMEQNYANLFKWRSANIKEGFTAQYIRLTPSQAPMELGELGIFDQGGNPVSGSGAAKLFDEQETIPSSPTFLNGMYFDEIYHGRTAFEILRKVYPYYETAHPPLAKILMSLGVAIFGMVPFGWRFTGALFGAAILPIFYVFLKNLFGKTPIAICGMILFGFDFMRFVQTRIATIDTYAVFFILLSYLFMYHYITQPYDKPFRPSMGPLALSGISFGIGCACKWVVVYGGAGLLALYLIYMVNQYRSGKPNPLRLFNTLLLSALFFIVIPIVIYCLSYVPYGFAQGMGIKMFWNPRFYKTIWDAQTVMFSYHARLVATHPYSSWWYQWIFNLRPILYYLDTSMGNGLKSSFAAFGNPVVWWGGLLAIILLIVRCIRLYDSAALAIVIGYFSQLGPWLLVTRIVFAYHYFPSTMFLILALAHIFNTLWDRPRGRLAVYAVTAGAGLMFVMFYPVLSGIAVPEFYNRNFLKWVPGWPL